MSEQSHISKEEVQLTFEMIPLETNRRVLTWLCIYPAEENCTNLQKWTYRVFSSCVFLLNVFAASASACYFYRQISIDLEDALFALIQMIGGINIVYINVITFTLRRKIVRLFNQLSKYYEQKPHGYSNDVDPFNSLTQYLERANSISESIWKYCCKFVIAGSVNSITYPVVLASMIYMKNGFISAESLYKPFKLVLPWNQYTLLGYGVEVIVGIVCSVAFAITSSFIILFISLCLHQRAFYEMFRHMLGSFEFPEKNKLNGKRLRQIVQFHCSIRSFFNESAKCFSLFLFVQLTSTMMMTSGCVFQLELVTKRMNATIAVITVMLTFSVSLLFLYCFMGKMATESYREMADCIFYTDWTSMPVKHQKCLTMMIRIAQQPLYYHGFGVIVLDLVTFTKLLKTVGSYYMMFKAMTATG